MGSQSMCQHCIVANPSWHTVCCGKSRCGRVSCPRRQRPFCLACCCKLIYPPMTKRAGIASLCGTQDQRHVELCSPDHVLLFGRLAQERGRESAKPGMRAQPGDAGAIERRSILSSRQSSCRTSRRMCPFTWCAHNLGNPEPQVFPGAAAKTQPLTSHPLAALL